MDHHRSEVHNTTIIDGKVQKDPKGNHVTFSYKTLDHLKRETHIACHGYVNSPITLELREATFASEKADSVLKHNSKKAWPSMENLYQAPDIYVSHLESASSDTNPSQDTSNPS
ncbi:hypothetical protein E4U52_003430 [Claviceps spartinae]|nr:hypothetical protein E4U52_003430 [Claviceps spartinae]